MSDRGLTLNNAFVSKEWGGCMIEASMRDPMGMDGESYIGGVGSDRDRSLWAWFQCMLNSTLNQEVM